MRSSSHPARQAIAGQRGVALLIGAVVACARHGMRAMTGPVVAAAGHRGPPAAGGRRGPGLPVPGPDDGRHGPAARPRGSSRATPAGLLGLRRRHLRELLTTTRCVIDAYLAEGTRRRGRPGRDHRQWLVYLQAHDPAARRAHCATGTRRPPWITPGAIQVADPASSTGDPGLGRAGSRAAVRRHPDPGLPARARSRWATGSSRAAGTGAGRAATRAATPRSGAKIEWKLNRAQHRRVRVLPAAGPGDRQPGLVVERAAWARRFVVSMWDPGQGRFYLGTTDDGVTPNDSRAGRGREQLVLPGPPGSRVRGVGGLGRVATWAWPRPATAG